MAKFDESKVINSLHKYKAEVGKKYWFGDFFESLKEYVEDDVLAHCYELTDVVEESVNLPFENEGICHAFIYPYEEPSKQRMTNRQLAEWLVKGNGQVKLESDGYICTYTYHQYLDNKDDDFVDDCILIRPWDSDEWIEPTVDIYERDCK